MKAAAEIRIGGWQFDASSNRLIRDGHTVTLEPLASSLLEYLAVRPGEVVTTDELVETFWPRKFVGDSPVYRIIGDLRHALGDNAQRPRYIETIRKRGYRLIAPVERIPGPPMRAADAATEISVPAARQHDASVERSLSTRRFALPAALLAGLAIAATVGWLATPETDETPTADDDLTLLSVAVLPFVDISAARDGEHIGDGITEALIHQLVQAPNMRVIARNSSFTFKGTNTDVREVGRLLNVETVLEGSVQRERQELRVTAQLVDARTGMHIWSRRFDRSEADIFAVQDEIALAVYEEIAGGGLEPADSPRSADLTAVFDAYDFYLLGRARLRSRATEEATRLFMRALELDPDFALAHTGLAEASLYEAGRQFLGLTPDADAVERARQSIDKALELDPNEIGALASRILLAQLDRNWTAVDEAFAEALERGPGYALTYYYYADALFASALESFDRPRADRALEYFLRARALDPLNPLVARSLALNYRRIGWRAEAMAEAHKVYELANTDDDMLLALDLLAYMAYELGEPDRAIALTHVEATLRGAFSPTGVHRIAESYYYLGDLDRASEWFAAELEDRDEEYLGYQARLAREAGDIAQFEAIIDELLNDPPSIVSAEFALSDVIMLLAEANQCERILAVGRQITDSPFREAQPVSDLYVAACHLQLATGEAGPYEERLRRHLRNYEAFGYRSRIGLLLQSSIAAVLRDRGKALERMDEALEMGFFGIRWLKNDVLFEWLAMDEQYIRLILTAERKNTAMLERAYAAEENGDWWELAGIEPKSRLSADVARGEE